MKQRYRLFLRRRSVYYAFDTHTRLFESLRTGDKVQAARLLQAMNDAHRQPAINLQLARVYLQHADPEVGKRTWQQVMDEIVGAKSGSTKERWQMAIKDASFDSLRNRKLLETTAEQLLGVLKAGSVSTNVFLRRLHNFALGMNWLPWPALPRKMWPAVIHKAKRAITLNVDPAVLVLRVFS